MALCLDVRSIVKWAMLTITIALIKAPLRVTVEPRFNELPRDRGNAFVISRVR